MKYIDCGSFYTVRVSRREVDNFRSQWPCSHLPSRAISFQFDKQNGDLVDLFGASSDGGGDLLALSQDAQKFGENHLEVQ